MTLLRIALLCAAVTCLVDTRAVHADDQPAQPSGQAPTDQPPAIHCDGQNCLPPAEDPVMDCTGAPAPPTDQTPTPEIQKVK
jgi:hypothetical protein